MGVLMSPVYYHMKGNLWACEQAHLQMLSCANINTDRMVALLFKSRGGERDSRQPASGLACSCGRPCG